MKSDENGGDNFGIVQCAHTYSENVRKMESKFHQKL
jgi:hypothetical protein